MKGLPRRPRRVGQIHAVAEKQKYLAVPYSVLGTKVPGTASVIGQSGFRIAALLLIALMAHSVGCARRFPATEVTTIKAANPAELQRYLLSRKPDVAQFKLRGPFAVTERRDLEIRLASGLTVEADLYLCAAARKAPLGHRVARSRQFQGGPCLPSDALGLLGHA